MYSRPVSSLEWLLPEDLRAVIRAVDKVACITLTNKDGDILFVNDIFLRYAQYSRDEVIGKNHRFFKSGFHPPEFYTNLWKTISNGKTWRGDVLDKAKDGTTFWVDTAITPIFGDSGDIIRYLAIRLDISERKKFEQELELSVVSLKKNTKRLAQEKAKTEAIIRSIGDGVIVVDGQGSLNFMNKVAEQLLGDTLSSLKKSQFCDVFRVEEEGGRRLTVAELPSQQAFLKGKIIRRNDLILPLKDGERISVSVTASPIILKKRILVAWVSFGILRLISR